MSGRPALPDGVSQLIERLWPGRPARVEPLPGGITNTNFLVDLSDEQVVVRIPGVDTELLGIDRRHEVAANRLAATIGVAPEVLIGYEAEGCLVTRFVPGRPVTRAELANEPMLTEVADTLRQIHGAGTIGAVFDPHSIVRQYHETAASRGVAEPFDYRSALSVLERIAAVRSFRPVSFCHNDLLWGNFLHDDRLRVLDWEYAGMGDPFFDLANFSVNNELSPDATENLLIHYFGHCDARLSAVLELMKLVSELREAMWGVVQLAVSKLDVDFAAYARERGERFAALLGAMDFAELTRRAADPAG